MNNLAIKFDIGDQVVVRASGPDSDVGTISTFRDSRYTYSDGLNASFYLVEVKFWSDPEATHVFWNYELNHAQV